MNSLPSDEVRAHLVADALRHRWRIVVAVALLFTVAVGAFALSQSPSYTATAKVLVQPIPGNALTSDLSSNTSQTTVAMETEASLVTSPEVTTLANKTLRDNLDAGSPAVTATVPENTLIVRIDFKANSRARAQAGAQAFATAFLAYRSDKAKANVKFTLDSLEKQAKTAQDNLKRASTTASGPKPPPDAASQVQLYASRLAGLQASIGELQTTNTQSGSVVTPARVPDSRTGVSPALLIGAAALLSIAGGLAIAIARERNDDHIRASAEPVLMGVPVLATIPWRSMAQIHQLGSETGSDEELDDAFRRARTGILASTQGPAVLAVSAVEGREPVAEVATGLARTLLRAGYNTVLVDASVDGSGPSDSLLDEDNDGLAKLLSDDAVSSIALVEVDGLKVLASGVSTESVRDLYASDRLAAIFKTLSGTADFVVVAAPDSSTAEGSAVALASDAVALVATDRLTTHRHLEDTLDRLHTLGASVLGIVVTPRHRPAAPRSSKDDDPAISDVTPARESADDEASNARRRTLWHPLRRVNPPDNLTPIPDDAADSDEQHSVRK